MAKFSRILIALLAITIIFQCGRYTERSVLGKKARKKLVSNTVQTNSLSTGSRAKLLKMATLIAPASSVNPPRSWMITSKHELPSTRAIKELTWSDRWPILSLTINKNRLERLLQNPRGRGQAWEETAFLTYVKEGKILIATAGGLRLHGGSRLPSKNWRDFRFYFRGRYGLDPLPAGTILSPIAGNQKAIVILDDSNVYPVFHNLLAFEFFRRLGCRIHY